MQDFPSAKGCWRSVGVALVAGMLSGCAAEPATPTPQPTVPTEAPPPPAVLRPLAHAKVPHDRDWYPPHAKQAHVGGRVLIRFTVGPNGRARDVTVLAAQATAELQNAAADLVRGVTFDVSEATDPTPFLVSVNYCVVPCSHALPPYPGYEKNTVTITGSNLPPP